MKVYVLIYQSGMSGTVKKVYYDKDTANKKAKKLNGNGIRNGTYEVIETEIYEDEKEEHCRACYNYNVGEGIDDIRKCCGCKWE